MDCQQYAEKKCNVTLRYYYMIGVWLSPDARRKWLDDCIRSEKELCEEGIY